LKFRCTVCNYVYDEEREGKSFASLPSDWKCPVCGSPKSVFVPLDEAGKAAAKGTTVSDVLVEQLEEWGVCFFFGTPARARFSNHYEAEMVRRAYTAGVNYYLEKDSSLTIYGTLSQKLIEFVSKKLHK
jgi:rubredoxin